MEEGFTGRKRIVAIAPHDRGWTNVELVKDCGLIPYLLYRNHNCDAVMVGEEYDEYTYLDTYVNGLRMEFLKDSMEETKMEYIRDNAEKIDCLLLRGCHPMNFSVAILYKQLNPKGVIYVGLDANSRWMDRIIWTDSYFMEFMDQCDIIATSCRAVQRYLNEKWPWVVEYIPNGYYDYGKNYDLPEFDKKENVILTVGRLGTQQKATNVLLEAFAMVSEVLPEWQLNLAGSIKPDFEEYLINYFEYFPELVNRVIFRGSFTDRSQLMSEYRNAKLFALTSEMEGGTPNVVGEALHAGCVMAVTKFDAYEEAIGEGCCGMAAEINDAEAFADILLSLCKNQNLSHLSENAFLYAKNNFDMQKIVARLNLMISKAGT